MKKLHFIYDKTVKAQNLKKIISKKYTNYKLSSSECFVVAGGDGFMLNTLKKYASYNKPFYGINCGSFGFLLNRYNNNDLVKKINRAKKTIINPLELSITSKNKKKRKLIAINEVSLFRQSRQTALLKLSIGKKTIIKRLVGDGVLISTPAGSTAYNLSVHGPILSLNSGKLAITPISPFRPRRWKGKIISKSSKVSVDNLDATKRPVAAVADNIEVRNVKTLSAKINNKYKLILLHDKERSLVKRIKIEQLRKNTT